jgi:hypothetical protein
VNNKASTREFIDDPGVTKGFWANVDTEIFGAEIEGYAY